MSSSRQRVLVTGASGLIGRHVCSVLAEQGHRVSALARRGWSGFDFLEESFGVDILETHRLAETLERAEPDVVIHLAWNGEDRMVSPLNIEHLKASMALLDACAASRVRRVITAGTGIEYAAVDSRRDELTTPCVPGTPYGAAKLAMGAALGAYVAQGAISGAHARIFYTFGPGEVPPRLIAYVMTELLAGRRPSVSAGAQRCDYLVVDDVAAALCRVALSDVEGPVNIGSGEAISIRSLILEAATAVGCIEDDIDFGERDPGQVNDSTICANIVRLRDEVGFSPAFSLSDAMSHTADYYRSQDRKG